MAVWHSRWLAILLLGGAAGFAAGPAGAISDQRDATPMTQALNDLMQFAQPGMTVKWDNPVTGNSGDVTAVRSFSSGGRNCWEYERSYTAPDGLKVVEGVSCELAPGLWEITSEGAALAKSSGTAPATTTAAPSPATAPTVAPAHDKATVRETQALLTALGYEPGPIDGAFGKKTKNAIAAYQRDNDMAETGEPTPEVLDALRNSVAARAGTTPAAPSTTATGTATTGTTTTGTTTTGTTTGTATTGSTTSGAGSTKVNTPPAQSQSTTAAQEPPEPSGSGWANPDQPAASMGPTSGGATTPLVVPPPPPPPPPPQ